MCKTSECVLMTAVTGLRYMFLKVDRTQITIADEISVDI
jgi:hypothetical protein